MSQNNVMTSVQQRPKFSIAITTKGFQDLIKNTIQDPKRRATFVSSITSAVAINSALSECTAESILSAALLGESLKLSPSPQLGRFYMVPFETPLKDSNGKNVYYENTKKTIKVKTAQFVLGYKGYIELAIRSGYYKNIDVIGLKEGEMKRWNRLNNEIEVEFVDDLDAREKLQTTHYYAELEYLNGFRKTMVWTHTQMLKHADEYSKAFNASSYHRLLRNEIPQDELWKYSSFWYKNFDAMALKTMLRQLISKWGVMSVELQAAFEKDIELANEINVTPDQNPEPTPTLAPLDAPITIEQPTQAIDIASL